MNIAPGQGLFEVIFINNFVHVYSPRPGQTTPWGQIFMSTERPCHFAHLLQVSKNLLEV